MHESMSIRSNSEFAEANPSSPLEDALERLYHQETRVEKAVTVLADRLSDVLQPEESTPLDATSGEKSATPRSRAVVRVLSSAGELASLATRIERLTDRLDV